MTATLSVPSAIASLLGDEAEDLLTHQAKVSKDLLHLPGPDWVDRIFA
ncbi:MAG: fructose-bisphosphate aldolase, partial [Microcoleus sp.]